MHRRQRTFAEFLTRSLAFAGLVYLLVLVYAVPKAVMADDSGSPTRLDRLPGWLSTITDEPRWRQAHEDRFPGCVDMTRWSAQAVPTTVVVVRRDGQSARMTFDEAFRRATSPSDADDVWTVGACR